MKRITFLFLLTSLVIEVFGQEIQVYLTKNYITLDSVIVGFEQDATIGVDDFLDEEDLYNIPHASFGVRSIQRDSANFSCAYQGFMSNNKIFYQNNYDLKKDIRNPTDTSIQNRTFEIIIFSEEFLDSTDVWIRTQDQSKLLDRLDMILYSGNSCENLPVWDYIETLENLAPNAGGFAAGSINYSTNIIIRFKRELFTPIKEIKYGKSVKVYPTIFKDEIFIASEFDLLDTDIYIFDLLGRVLISEKGKPSNLEKIECDNLTSGIYFIRIMNGNKLIHQGKLIKPR